jgi:flagellar basal-body rod protein FlgB
MNVFDVLSKHVDWAGQRYAVAAANVANVDSPGYRAKEISNFELEMNATAMRLMRTDPGHMAPGGQTGAQIYDVSEQASIDETHSGNNVIVESEMKTIGESARHISSDTAIYKIFQRMTIAAAKG